MYTYGELISALKSFKNVKDKRHAIRSLAILCLNRLYQIRILKAEGWESAIQPLLTSLDQECRHHAALAVANLSTGQDTHALLLDGGVLPELVRITQEEEDADLAVYVVTAIGNLACSAVSWKQCLNLSVVSALSNCIRVHRRDEVTHACLFALANLTADSAHLEQMVKSGVLDVCWPFVYSANPKLYTCALLLVRGLTAQATLRDRLPSLGAVGLLVTIFKEPAYGMDAKELALDILANLSFSLPSAPILAGNEDVMGVLAAVLGDREKFPGRSPFVSAALCVVANMCADPLLHEKLVDSRIFPFLMNFAVSEIVAVQTHVVRALARLSMNSKKFHERILVACPQVLATLLRIAAGEGLQAGTRISAMHALSALSVSRPGGLIGQEIEVLGELGGLEVGAEKSDLPELAKYAAIALGNCATEPGNLLLLISKLESIIKGIRMMPEGGAEVIRLMYNCLQSSEMNTDSPFPVSMVGICMRFLEEISDSNFLSKTSAEGAVYLCNILRLLSVEKNCLLSLLGGSPESTSPRKGSRIGFLGLALPAWSNLLASRRLAPHLAQLLVTLSGFPEARVALVQQGVVRAAVRLFTACALDENVKLRSLIVLTNLAETVEGRKSLVAEDGLKVLVRACETESHMEILSTALRGLHSILLGGQGLVGLVGSAGGVVSVASFLWSDNIDLKKLALRVLLELLSERSNRSVFLRGGDSNEDFLNPLFACLPARQIPGPLRTVPKLAEIPFGEQRFFARPEFREIAHLAITCLRLLAQESSAQQRMAKPALVGLLLEIYNSHELDNTGSTNVVGLFAELLHAENDKLLGVVLGGSNGVVELLVSGSSQSDLLGLRCLSALIRVSRKQECQSLLFSSIPEICKITSHLVTEGQERAAAKALAAGLLADLANSTAKAAQKALYDCNALGIFFRLLESAVAGNICADLLFVSVSGILSLVGSSSALEGWIPLILEVLRLPEEEMSRSICECGVGLAVLDRAYGVVSSIGSTFDDDLKKFRVFNRWIWKHLLRVICVYLSAENEAPLQQHSIFPVLVSAVNSEDATVANLGWLAVCLLSHRPQWRAALADDRRIVEGVLSLVKVRVNSGGLTRGDPIRFLLCLLALQNITKEITDSYRGVGLRTKPKGFTSLRSEMSESVVTLSENMEFFNSLPDRLFAMIDIEVLNSVILKSSASKLLNSQEILHVEFSKIALVAIHRSLHAKNSSGVAVDKIAHKIPNFISILLNLTRSGLPGEEVLPVVLAECLTAITANHIELEARQQMISKVGECILLCKTFELSALSGLLANLLSDQTGEPIMKDQIDYRVFQFPPRIVDSSYLVHGNLKSVPEDALIRALEGVSSRKFLLGGLANAAVCFGGGLKDGLKRLCREIIKDDILSENSDLGEFVRFLTNCTATGRLDLEISTVVKFLTHVLQTFASRSPSHWIAALCLRGLSNLSLNFQVEGREQLQRLLFNYFGVEQISSDVMRLVVKILINVGDEESVYQIVEFCTTNQSVPSDILKLGLISIGRYSCNFSLLRKMLEISNKMEKVGDISGRLIVLQEIQRQVDLTSDFNFLETLTTFCEKIAADSSSVSHEQSEQLLLSVCMSALRLCSKEDWSSSRLLTRLMECAGLVENSTCEIWKIVLLVARHQAALGKVGELRKSESFKKFADQILESSSEELIRSEIAQLMLTALRHSSVEDGRSLWVDWCKAGLVGKVVNLLEISRFSSLLIDFLLTAIEREFAPNLPPSVVNSLFGLIGSEKGTSGCMRLLCHLDQGSDNLLFNQSNLPISWRIRAMLAGVLKGSMKMSESRESLRRQERWKKLILTAIGDQNSLPLVILYFQVISRFVPSELAKIATEVCSLMIPNNDFFLQDRSLFKTLGRLVDSAGSLISRNCFMEIITLNTNKLVNGGFYGFKILAAGMLDSDQIRERFASIVDWEQLMNQTIDSFNAISFQLFGITACADRIPEKYILEFLENFRELPLQLLPQACSLVRAFSESAEFSSLKHFHKFINNCLKSSKGHISFDALDDLMTGLVVCQVDDMSNKELALDLLSEGLREAPLNVLCRGGQLLAMSTNFQVSRYEQLIRTGLQRPKVGEGPRLISSYLANLEKFPVGILRVLVGLLENGNYSSAESLTFIIRAIANNLNKDVSLIPSVILLLIKSELVRKSGDHGAECLLEICRISRICSGKEWLKVGVCSFLGLDAISGVSNFSDIQTEAAGHVSALVQVVLKDSLDIPENDKETFNWNEVDVPGLERCLEICFRNVLERNNDSSEQLPLLVQVLLGLATTGFRFGGKKFPGFLSDVAESSMGDISRQASVTIAMMGGMGSLEAAQKAISESESIVSMTDRVVLPVESLWQLRALAAWSKDLEISKYMSQPNFIDFLTKRLRDCRSGKYAALLLHNMNPANLGNGCLSEIVSLFADKKSWLEGENMEISNSERKTVRALLLATLRNGIREGCDFGEYKKLLEISSSIDHSEVLLYLQTLSFLLDRLAGEKIDDDVFVNLMGFLQKLSEISSCLPVHPYVPRIEVPPPRVSRAESLGLGQARSLYQRQGELRKGEKLILASAGAQERVLIGLLCLCLSVLGKRVEISRFPQKCGFLLALGLTTLKQQQIESWSDEVLVAAACVCVQLGVRGVEKNSVRSQLVELTSVLLDPSLPKNMRPLLRSVVFIGGLVGDLEISSILSSEVDACPEVAIEVVSRCFPESSENLNSFFKSLTGYLRRQGDCALSRISEIGIIKGLVTRKIEKIPDALLRELLLLGGTLSPEFIFLLFSESPSSSWSTETVIAVLDTVKVLLQQKGRNFQIAASVLFALSANSTTRVAVIQKRGHLWLLPLLGGEMIDIACAILLEICRGGDPAVAASIQSTVLTECIKFIRKREPENSWLQRHLIAVICLSVIPVKNKLANSDWADLAEFMHETVYPSEMSTNFQVLQNVRVLLIGDWKYLQDAVSNNLKFLLQSAVRDGAIAALLNRNLELAILGDDMSFLSLLTVLLQSGTNFHGQMGIELLNRALKAPGGEDVFIEFFCLFLSGIEKEILKGINLCPELIRRFLQAVESFLILEQSNNFSIRLHVELLPKSLRLLGRLLTGNLCRFRDEFVNVVLLLTGLARCSDLRGICVEICSFMLTKEELLSSDLRGVLLGFLGHKNSKENIEISCKAILNILDRYDNDRSILEYFEVLVPAVLQSSPSESSVEKCFCRMISRMTPGLLHLFFSGKFLCDFMVFPREMVSNWLHETMFVKPSVSERLVGCSGLLGMLEICSYSDSKEIKELAIIEWMRYSSEILFKFPAAGVDRVMSAAILDQVASIVESISLDFHEKLLNFIIQGLLEDRHLGLRVEIQKSKKMMSWLVKMMGKEEISRSGRFSALASLLEVVEDLTEDFFRVYLEHREFFSFANFEIVGFVLSKSEELKFPGSGMRSLLDMWISKESSLLLGNFAAFVIAKLCRSCVIGSDDLDALLLQAEETMKATEFGKKWEDAELILSLKLLSGLSDKIKNDYFLKGLLETWQCARRPLTRRCALLLIAEISRSSHGWEALWRLGGIPGFKRTLAEPENLDILEIVGILGTAAIWEKGRRNFHVLLSEEIILATLFEADRRASDPAIPENVKITMDSVMTAILGYFLEKEHGNLFDPLYAETVSSVLARMMTRALSSEISLAPILFLISKLIIEESQKGRADLIAAIVRLVPVGDFLRNFQVAENHVAQGIFSALLLGLRLPVNSVTVSDGFLQKYYLWLGGLVRGLVDGVGYAGNFFVDLPQSAPYRMLCGFITSEDKMLSKVGSILVSECMQPPLCLQPGANASAFPKTSPCTVVVNPPQELVRILDSLLLDNMANQHELVHAVYALAIAVNLLPQRALKASFLLPLVTQEPKQDEDISKEQRADVINASIASMHLGVFVIGSVFRLAGGPSETIKMEGGRDLLRYMIEYIISQYTSQTIYIRKAGSIWKKLCFTEGLNVSIAQLLLLCIQSDDILVIAEKLGVYQALKELHAYCENPMIRKEAASALNRILRLVQNKMTNEVNIAISENRATLKKPKQ